MENEQQESMVFDIYPTKSSRRILVFFADILIFFISCLFLFEIICVPSMKAIIDYNSIMLQTNEYYANQDRILADNNILFLKQDGKNYRDHIIYTSELYIEDYVMNPDNITKDVAKNYFVDVKKQSIDELNNIYSSIENDLFDNTKKTNIGTYQLKDKYITLLRPKFIEGDDLSEDGEKLFENIKNGFFLNLYGRVMSDVVKEDLISPLKPNLLSYNTYTNRVKESSKKIDNGYVICSFVVFGVCSVIFYFLIPLVNHKGQTVSEMILKVERIDINNYDYLKRRFITVEGMINTLESTTIIFLMPVISMGFARVFSLSSLFSLSIVGAIFLIIQLIFLLANKFNRTIKELGTNSIAVDTSTMDEYYKVKGYEF